MYVCMYVGMVRGQYVCMYVCRYGQGSVGVAGMELIA